jgi:hypothetical protein
MCNRALQFREFGQNGTAILLYLDRAGPDWEPAYPCTLRSPGREIYRNVAWRSTALWTMARRDFSSARLVCNNSKTGRKRGGRNGSTGTELLMKKNVKMDVKTSFFDVMSEVQKGLQEVSLGIGLFLKIRYTRILSGNWRQS